MERRRITPFARPSEGSANVPGSKSHTNRVLLCAALADGVSRISGALFADDTEAMLEAVRALGAKTVIVEDEEILEINGVGKPPLFGNLTVDFRSSGTTSRFLIPVIAAGHGTAVVDGSEQLRSRPFGEQLAALNALGAQISSLNDSDELPLEIHARGVKGGEIEVSGEASSQFISGLLMAAPLFEEGLTLKVPGRLVSRPYVDLTVEVMSDFGVFVEMPDDSTFVVRPQTYAPSNILIEPDASAASYFFAAAAITGGTARVEGLNAASLQGDIEFVRVLEKLGAKVVWDDAYIQVEGRGLSGGHFDLSDFSDTAQTLASVAAFADSEVEITGVGFIRAKETNRIAALVSELTKCGVEVSETNDGLKITPNKWLLRGAEIDTYEDHRMAMSMSLIGLRVPGLEIRDPSCVEKTFPSFYESLEMLRPKPQKRPDLLAIIAIDGPAGSGKSTVAKQLARELRLPNFDTGAMYRAVAAAALRANVHPSDLDGISAIAQTAEIAIGERIFIDGSDATEEIRSPEVNQLVSVVAATSSVRKVLVPRQRKWATDLGGGVMEGRDIGTKVFPDATFKVFLTAELAIRAQRRFDESSGVSFEDVLSDLKRRDHVDSTRSDSPLEVAPGALIFDSSRLSTEEVVGELAIIFDTLIEP